MTDPLRELSRRANGPREKLAPLVRQCVVDTVNSDGTCDLTIAGSDTVIPDVVCLAHVMPYAAATVWCAQFGADLLVVGIQEVATGWSIDSGDFSIASGWSLTSVRWMKAGSLSWCYVVANRTGSGITVSSGDGNITDVDVVTVPTYLRPTAGVYGQGGGAGRVLACVLGTGGVIAISAVAGDGTNIATSDNVSLWFACYPTT